MIIILKSSDTVKKGEKVFVRITKQAEIKLNRLNEDIKYFNSLPYIKGEVIKIEHKESTEYTEIKEILNKYSKTYISSIHDYNFLIKTKFKKVWYDYKYINKIRRD